MLASDQVPHAVYWMYNNKMELLFIGCSYRLMAHLDQQNNRDGIRAGTVWFTEVAAIKVKWHPNRQEAQEAEAKAVLAHEPKYSMHWNSPKNPRNMPDGLCPNCGKPKPRRTAGYCPDCAKAYQKDRNLQIRAGIWHSR